MDKQAHFEEFVKSAEFPCVGAKSALAHSDITFFNGGDIRNAQYDDLLYKELYNFGESLIKGGEEVQSFVVIYDSPRNLSEKEFEVSMWNRLQALHYIDLAAEQNWTTESDANPESAHFSMSIGGHAFFIVGMHPHASRLARRFDYPTLVFNSHEQFERLRNSEQFEKMQKVIRQRDVALNGDINPMLADYGEKSEAAQYSGRNVSPEWKCPLKIQT